MNTDSNKKKCLTKFHLKGLVDPINNTKHSDHNVTLISLRHILKMKRYIYLLSTLFAFQKNILISVNIQIISCLNAINWRHHPHSRWTQVQFCHLCEAGSWCPASQGSLPVEMWSILPVTQSESKPSMVWIQENHIQMHFSCIGCSL